MSWYDLILWLVVKYAAGQDCFGTWYSKARKVAVDWYSGVKNICSDWYSRGKKVLSDKWIRVKSLIEDAWPKLMYLAGSFYGRITDG